MVSELQQFGHHGACLKPTWFVLLLWVTAGCVGQASEIDAGSSDAGQLDAGLFDAGLFDAGLFETGLLDAGLLDAGQLDAAVALPCNGDVPTDGGLRVSFRDGQTFVRWVDRAPGVVGNAFRYDVYRSEVPITQATLPGATRVAKGVLSNSARQFGYAFSEADRLDPTRPMTIIASDGGPLPLWSGLQVVTAMAPACAYYAVIATAADGGALEPVMPGFNATATPIEERPEPRTSLLVIPAAQRADVSRNYFLISGTPGLPLRVLLHASQGGGGSAGDVGDLLLYFGDTTMGYRDGLPGVYSVEESNPVLSGGVQALTIRNRDTIVTPAGGPQETFWFGYATVPDWAPSAPIRVYPFTERRLDWLIREVIERYRADPERVTLSGGSMGGWGTLAFGLRHPERFAAIYPDRPRTQQRELPKVGVIVDSAQALMEDGVTRFHDRMDFVRFVSEHHQDLPFVAWGIGRQDGYATWKEQVDFVRALTAAHHGFAFVWDNEGHGSQVVNSVVAEYPPERFRLHQSYPALGNSSLDDSPGDGQVGVGALRGGINLGFDWSVQQDLETNWVVMLSNRLGSGTVDVTPRRCQRFRLSPGARVDFTSSTGQSQTLVADAHGLVTATAVTTGTVGVTLTFHLRP